MIRKLAFKASVSLCAAIACSLALSDGAGAATAPQGFRPFAPDSVWNLPLRGDAPVDARSSAYTAWLAGQMAQSGSWINTARCGMPTYWADADTPTTTVHLSSSAYQDRAMIRAWSAVPIPADAAPANCSDQNFAVIQTQPDGTRKAWEFWRAVKNADGTWTARWGGATSNVGADSGVGSKWGWSDPTALLTLEQRSSHSWNVTASSISMMAGVITASDVAQGRIDHALAMATPDTAKSRFVWPAQRTDGTSLDPAALPAGARLRIDPKLDLSKLTMPPLIRMMAEAAQRYGIVIRDRTWTTTVFYTEPVGSGQADPYKAALAGARVDAALKTFPWASLKVLAAPSCTGTQGCVAAQSAVISLSSVRQVGSPMTADTSNSFLDQPRAAVRWDLDGDGVFERDGGSGVRTTFTPAEAGPLTVGVQVTTRSGDVITRKRTLEVLPAPAAPVASSTPAALATPAPPAAAPPAAAAAAATGPASPRPAATATTKRAAQAKQRKRAKQAAKRRAAKRRAAKRSKQAHHRRRAERRRSSARR
jgi:hypothetical protein